MELTAAVTRLAQGEALGAFTDGVTDRRFGGRTFGEAGVVGAVLRGGHATAGELASAIEAAAVGFADTEPSADMAVLVLRAEPNRR